MVGTASTQKLARRVGVTPGEIRNIRNAATFPAQAEDVAVLRQLRRLALPGTDREGTPAP